MSDRKDIAFNLAERHGFAVFTLAFKTKVPHKGTHGLKDATRERAVIERMFEEHPNRNIAVAGGAVSGNIDIIDLDFDENGAYDGRDELTDWQAEHGKFPATACVVTGRGGSQLYYRFPEGTPDSYKNEVAHVDFRGEKGYAMLPGSIHPNGREVYWDLDPDETPIADADDNVIAFVEHFRPEAERPVGSEDGGDGKKKPFELPDVLREGARDETIYKWACSERAKNTPKDVVLVAAHAYNRAHCEPPLPDSIIDQKVESAFKHDPGASRQAKGGDGIETISGASIWSNPHLEAKYDSNGTFIGYYAPTVPALVWWMQEDPGLVGIRLELMSQQVVIENGLPWGKAIKQWRAVDDDYLFSRMKERYKDDGKSLVRSDENVFKAFSIFSDQNSFDVLVAALDALPEWDGTPRKDALLIECLGAEDSEYTRAVTALMLRAAVTRAYELGRKYDYMVVLQGPRASASRRCFARWPCATSSSLTT